MSDIVIRAEALGKQYIIGHQAERGGYTALRDVLAQQARGLWSKTRDLVQGKPHRPRQRLPKQWYTGQCILGKQRRNAEGG
jgi:lipopolysaccharide transport system ATP-binding protein